MKALQVLQLSAAAGDPRECQTCRVPLDLHQLDDDTPDRLLGVCPECERVVLLFETSDGWTAAVALVLPDRTELLASVNAA